MPDFMPPVGAVQTGRLVESGVDGSHGRQVEDAAPAEVPPNVDHCVHDGEILRLHIQKEGFAAHHHDEFVDDAVAAQKGKRHAGHHHAGNEVRHVACRLGKLFELDQPHFIDQQRKNDRDPKRDAQVHGAEHQGVFDEPPEIRVMYKC